MRYMYNFQLDECVHFAAPNHCYSQLYPISDYAEQVDSVVMKQERKNKIRRLKEKRIPFGWNKQKHQLKGKSAEPNRERTEIKGWRINIKSVARMSITNGMCRHCFRSTTNHIKPLKLTDRISRHSAKTKAHSIISSLVNLKTTFII